MRYLIDFIPILSQQRVVCNVSFQQRSLLLSRYLSAVDVLIVQELNRIE